MDYSEFKLKNTYLSYRGKHILLNCINVSCIRDTISLIDNFLKLENKLCDLEKNGKEEQIVNILDVIFDPKNNSAIHICFYCEKEFYTFCELYKKECALRLSPENSYIKQYNLFSNNPKPLKNFIDCNNIKIEGLGTVFLVNKFNSSAIINS